ncbi:hypothetical protein GmHk_U060263 [Glycine max]|nr:hypothetical protein GmHk_U060263 [Glycine max]
MAKPSSPTNLASQPSFVSLPQRKFPHRLKKHHTGKVCKGQNPNPPPPFRHGPMFYNCNFSKVCLARLVVCHEIWRAPTLDDIIGGLSAKITPKFIF